MAAADKYHFKKAHLPTQEEIQEYEDVMERFPRVPQRAKLWTPWFTIGVVIIAVGFLTLLARFIFGLGAVTNLSNGFPWGLWITFDVVIGIALASGGYTTAALVYVFNDARFSPLIRPAITTALLGYAMAGFGVFIDVGRWWQIYNPLLPSMWHGGSALFEVSICVMAYLSVLVIEYIPTLTDRFIQGNKPAAARRAMNFRRWLDKFMILFILTGIVISTLHQSSLGAIMLLAPERLNALWYSPWLPAFFLLSSIAVGWHVVIVESIMSAKSFGRRIEMPLLAGLAKRTIIFLGLYVIVKFYDLIFYDEFGLLFQSWYGLLWFAEVALFGIIPSWLLATPWVRRDPKLLFWTSWMVIAGLMLSRADVFLFAFKARPGWNYFPSLGEFVISAMMVSIIMVGYKVLANFFPVLNREETLARA